MLYMYMCTILGRGPTYTERKLPPQPACLLPVPQSCGCTQHRFAQLFTAIYALNGALYGVRSPLMTKVSTEA